MGEEAERGLPALQTTLLGPLQRAEQLSFCSGWHPQNGRDVRQLSYVSYIFPRPACLLEGLGEFHQTEARLGGLAPS